MYAIRSYYANIKVVGVGRIKLPGNVGSLGYYDIANTFERIVLAPCICGIIQPDGKVDQAWFPDYM